MGACHLFSLWHDSERDTNLKTDETAYCTRLAFSSSMLDLAPFQLSEKEVAIVYAGMKAALTGKFEIDPAKYGEQIQDFAQKRVLARAEIEQQRGQAFVQKAAKEPGAKVSPSGLVMTIKTMGQGPKPQPNSTVKVHYRGTLIDGTEFDSSIGRGEPATFPLNRVIPVGRTA